MRDINRIYPLCNEIARLWSDCPDQRFMQLLSNFTVWLGRDPFYMEDDEFLEQFTEYIKPCKMQYKREG